ncbi:LysM peptidoglycan-binding domain-containing protein [Enterococcus gilvus]|nr:LysM domain-containing protein [Enterococcus gilvus]
MYFFLLFMFDSYFSLSSDTIFITINTHKKEGETLKKIVGILSLLLLTVIVTACGNNVTTKDLKAHDWQMDMEENKEDINFKVSFSDHVMTWAPDMSTMKSEASDEWEKMGEDLGKQIAGEIKYKVEYELKGKTIHLKEADLKLDDDYTIQRDGKDIVLTPDKKDAKKLVLIPYSNKTSKTKSSSTKPTSEKKKSVDLNRVIDKFKKDGLEVNEPRKMTKDDYGMAPLKAKEGLVFGVQMGSDGEYQNARIFSFESESDLKDTQSYYDDLGKASSATFSYTAADKDKLVLMQFNGDLPIEVVDKYVNNADLTLTPVSFDTDSSDSQDMQDESINSSSVETEPEQQLTPQQQPAQQQSEQPSQQADTQQATPSEDSQSEANAQYGTAQAGEGPRQIAGRYGMSVDEFLEMNGMNQDNFYFNPGQEVRVK